MSKDDAPQDQDHWPPEDLADHQPPRPEAADPSADLASAMPAEAALGDAHGPETDPFETESIIEEPRDMLAIPLPTEPADQRIARLREKARTLAQTPGVYLMKDIRDVVIYVGKSRCLRDR